MKAFQSSTTTLLLLLLAVICVNTTATDLRGRIHKEEATTTTAETSTTTRRALMPAGTECVTYQRVVMFDDSKKQDNVNEDKIAKSWACQLSQADAEKYGVGMVEFGASNDAMEKAGALSGITLATITEPSYLQQVFVSNSFGGGSNAPPTLYIPADAPIILTEMDEHTDERHYRHRQRRRRRLAPSTGTLETLVIRTVDANHQSTQLSKENLLDDVFGDESCLKTRYEECSYGKVRIHNAGVVDVPVPDVVASGAHYKEFESGAREAVNNAYGGSFETLSAQFDLVLFCQPPGSFVLDARGEPTTSWVAYAFVNRIESFYNDDWCGMVSAQMHEVGHSLGLAHSGVAGKTEYDDLSDAMGYSVRLDDGPDKCFNAAKSYQLGWYEDKVGSIDPLRLENNANAQEFRLIGVADYETIDGGLVSLRLEHEGHLKDGKEWYVGYMRKSGINHGVPENVFAAPDTVHLIEKTSTRSSAYDFGVSYRIAALEAHQEHTWTVGGHEVRLRVDWIHEGVAGITVFNTLPGGTKQPTAQPSASPVSPPSVPPTQKPTGSPTPMPKECTTPEGKPGKTLRLEARLDDMSGSQFGWMVANGATGEGWYGEDNFEYRYGEVIAHELCLPKEECWNIVVRDLGNDGICAFSMGQPCYYKAWIDGIEVVSSDGLFGSEASHTVCIGTHDVCQDTASGKFRYRNKRRSKKTRRTTCRALRKEKSRHQRKLCGKFLGRTGRTRVDGGACSRTCGEAGAGPCAFLQNYAFDAEAVEFPLPGGTSELVASGLVPV